MVSDLRVRLYKPKQTATLVQNIFVLAARYIFSCYNDIDSPLKGTVMQIEKARKNNRFCGSKVY